MAIPPSDIILAVIPCIDITINAAKTPSGKVIIATNADLAWSKNIRQTRATTIPSSINL